MSLISEHNDKQVKPDQVEQRGVVSDVAVPIGQAVATGAVGGAVNAWVSDKLGGGQKPPPDKDK